MVPVDKRKQQKCNHGRELHLKRRRFISHVCYDDKWKISFSLIQYLREAGCHGYHQHCKLGVLHWRHLQIGHEPADQKNHLCNEWAYAVTATPAFQTAQEEQPMVANGKFVRHNSCMFGNIAFVLCTWRGKKPFSVPTIKEGNCLFSLRGSVKTGNSESTGRACVRRADTEKERTKTLRANGEDWIIALVMRAMKDIDGKED